jgi:glyoxylase-like metal-dependent hydrolase (beta-lactamase superfamily II)
VVVDPSGSAVEIRLRLASAGAGCGGILLTHCHWDHFLGLAELADGTGAPVWLPRDEEAVFRRPDAVYEGLGVRVPPFAGEATLVAGGETIEVSGIVFDVVAVPGHSPGHVAYHADGHLFSGDVLFAGGVGRVDLPGGDWQALLDSVQRLLDGFGPEAVVYPGHGEPTTIGHELETNPFLGELRAARRG